MLTLVALTLWQYVLGGVWIIGPFTDLTSCQAAHDFQVTHGVGEVTPCRPVLHGHYETEDACIETSWRRAFLTGQETRCVMEYRLGE